jgi:hypothetical protein
MSEVGQINLVYIDKRSGEVKRLRVREEIYEYIISTRARWEPVVAMEKVSLRANNVYQINIREIRLSPNELVIPCPVTWNSLGPATKRRSQRQASKSREGKGLQLRQLLSL